MISGIEGRIRSLAVMPAKAGIHSGGYLPASAPRDWTPASAGVAR